MNAHGTMNSLRLVAADVRRRTTILAGHSASLGRRLPGSRRERPASIASVAMLIVDEFRKKARVNLRANRFWVFALGELGFIKGYMSIKEIVKGIVLLGRGEWRRDHLEGGCPIVGRARTGGASGMACSRYQ